VPLVSHLGRAVLRWAYLPGRPDRGGGSLGGSPGLGHHNHSCSCRNVFFFVRTSRGYTRGWVERPANTGTDGPVGTAGAEPGSVSAVARPGSRACGRAGGSDRRCQVARILAPSGTICCGPRAWAGLAQQPGRRVPGRADPSSSRPRPTSPTSSTSPHGAGVRPGGPRPATSAASGAAEAEGEQTKPPDSQQAPGPASLTKPAIWLTSALPPS
jgi:hypothetical protein